MSGHKAAIVMGRTVIVERQDSETSIPVQNPAIITRHHGAGMINCRVLEDGYHIPWLTSIPKRHKLGPHEVQPLNWWFWPPRSPAARAEGEAERRDADEPETTPAMPSHPGPADQVKGPSAAPRPGAPHHLRSGPPRKREPAVDASTGVPDDTAPVIRDTGEQDQDQTEHPAPNPPNPDGSSDDPAKKEGTAPPAEPKPGDHFDRSGPSMPPTGYRP